MYFESYKSQSSARAPRAVVLVAILVTILLVGLACAKPVPSANTTDQTRSAPSGPGVPMDPELYAYLTDYLFTAMALNTYLEVYESGFADVSRIHTRQVGTVRLPPSSALEFSYCFVAPARLPISLVDTRRQWMWAQQVIKPTIQDWIDQSKAEYTSRPNASTIALDKWLRIWTAYETYNMYLGYLREGYRKGWMQQVGLEEAVTHMSDTWGIELSCGLEEAVEVDYSYPLTTEGMLGFTFVYKGTEVFRADEQFLDAEGRELPARPFQGSMTF